LCRNAISWSNLESTVQQFAAHGTVGYTQRKPHRATLSGELMAVLPLRLMVMTVVEDDLLVSGVVREEKYSAKQTKM
jgi:hypothetical protein